MPKNVSKLFIYTNKHASSKLISFESNLFKISISSFVSSVELSQTKIFKSAFSEILILFSTPIFSTTSSVCLIPAVSIKFKIIPLRTTLPSTISLVVPGIEVTIAFSSSKNAFKILLLPTFGFPTNAMSIPCFISLLFSAFFNKSFIESLKLISLGFILSLV